jgi:hypothetical protein
MSNSTMSSREYRSGRRHREGVAARVTATGEGRRRPRATAVLQWMGAAAQATAGEEGRHRRVGIEG